MTELRIRLALAELRAELLERGLHPLAVRGLLADKSITDRVAFDEAGNLKMEIAVLASEIVRDVPRSMLRDAESAEDWARRRFGAAEAYISKTYSRPSKAALPKIGHA
ncbi:MAG TPA: hypothetical protein VJL35_00710 [Gemmatimonadaceae bacterium]|nr:hypothetical protein [Gemmatimonadaceae bacterium]